jgi:Zn-dependent protease
MIKPAFLKVDDQPTVVGHVFSSPLVVKGWTGLPLIELGAWVVLTWVAGQRHPDWSMRKRISAGVVTSTILLGTEWCHNLAHTFIASKIRKPVDAIRIYFGTPLLIYYDINDQQVSPSQHITRALGGPIFNALMIPFAWLVKQYTREGTLIQYAANFALGINGFISIVSLLPIPGIDGGPLLKWSLVETGRTPAEADDLVRGVNLALGSGLAIATGVAVKKRRKWLALVIAAFAATSFAIGLGLLKEQK